jgi:hypothetical protein
LSYKFFNIVAAKPGDNHGNPHVAEWLRQHASSLAGPLHGAKIVQISRDVPDRPRVNGLYINILHNF